MMKKSLIALAVVAASGMAMAQSSVTLYGVADAGIGKAPGEKAKFLGGTARTNNGPSRVGFTGVEDLGNGNKVGFQFETGLRLEDGKPASGGTDMDGKPADNTTNPPTPAVPAKNNFWARQANVFFGGSWGTVKMGRQVTVGNVVEGVFDLTGQANYSPIDVTFAAAGTGGRADSAISYVSPNMSGFQAAVAYVHKNNIGANAKSIWEIGAWYKNGGLGVGLSANKNVVDKKTQYQVGGKYDFGNFAVGASYHRNNIAGKAATATTPATPTGQLKGFSLSGQAKFGAFTTTLSAVRVTKDSAANKKYTNAVLEGKYALSKRTFLYADIYRDGKVKKTGWGLGVHHSFF